VCGIVKSGQAPAVVPDAVINDIRRRERDGVIELRQLRTGSRVRILSGPFRNQLGLCANMNGRSG
jgi:transcription antitermination factor NusG